MFNPFSLENKTILVTGASSGIGRQCAIDCSKMGARVVLIARNLERLNETLSQMEGESHLVKVQDLTKTEEFPLLIKDIVKEIGPLDGAVFCAGISNTEPLKLVNVERLNDFFTTNVYSSIILTREICKLKNANKLGISIVFISSVMGIVGESCKVSYSLTKGALLSGIKSLAVEYANRRIRFNCISPGVVKTAINANQHYMTDSDLQKKIEDKHLLGFGTCPDVSNACIYLLSDASRWVTGQNLIVDGGYTVI